MMDMRKLVAALQSKKIKYIILGVIVVEVFILLFFDKISDRFIFQREIQTVNEFYSNQENFIKAIVSNNLEVQNEFLKIKGTDINYQDKIKKRPIIIWALSVKNYNLASKLLEAGADPNKYDPQDNLYPIHIAIADSNLPFIRKLIEHGALIDVVESRKGLRPIDLAKAKKNNEILDYLEKLKVNKQK